jgi:hypothetical protein
MDNLEKVEVEKLLPMQSIPEIPSFSSIQEWVGEHLFEIALVIILLVFVFYKYGQKEISLSKGYKSILDEISDSVNRFFGRFWLSSNMEGKAIRTKVRFNEEENQEYDDDRAEEIRSVMYI